MADTLKDALIRHLGEVSQWPEEELVARRYDRLRAQGVFRAT
jgi:acetyl-CoA carboxylase alpha subunit